MWILYKEQSNIDFTLGLSCSTPRGHSSKIKAYQTEQQVRTGRSCQLPRYAYLLCGLNSTFPSVPNYDTQEEAEVVTERENNADVSSPSILNIRAKMKVAKHNHWNELKWYYVPQCGVSSIFQATNQSKVPKTKWRNLFKRRKKTYCTSILLK
jgi:hypothetical protein